MGVILFQLLTRQVPFDAENAIGIVLKHVTEEPRNPRDVYAGVNPKLEAICLRAMKKKRDERYQTAREMRTELRMALDGSVGGNLSLPMHATRTSGLVLAEPSLASAATVPLDPAEILAAERAQSHPGPEKETPLSTEAVDRPAGVPNRWTGYVAAFLIIAAVVGTGTYLTRSYLATANALPTATASASATPPVTAATSAAAILPDPTGSVASTSSTNVSSHVGTTGSSHAPTTLASKDAGARDAAPATSTSAAPSASAAVPPSPPPEAGAPTSVGGPVVKIGVPHNAVGVDGAKVRVALASMYEPLNACFAKGIKAGDAAAPATMKMHLDFDASSVGVGMGVPSTLSSTGPCIVNVAKRIHVDGTGSVDVDFELVP
jgi:serine/threonine-protein kinase